MFKIGDEVETWKPVIDYEGLYEVSNLGRVKSLVRHHVTKEIIKKQTKSKSGYMMINLSDGFNNKTFRVHRIVTLAFIPIQQNKRQVNHIDGNKSNNRVKNLEWVTPKENHRHAERIGLRNNKLYGEMSAKICSKPVYQIDKATNKIINKFKSIVEAANKTNTRENSISDCCHGRIKTTNGFKWKFYKEG